MARPCPLRMHASPGDYYIVKDALYAIYKRLKILPLPTRAFPNSGATQIYRMNECQTIDVHKAQSDNLVLTQRNSFVPGFCNSANNWHEAIVNEPRHKASRMKGVLSWPSISILTPLYLSANNGVCLGVCLHVGEGGVGGGPGNRNSVGLSFVIVDAQVTQLIPHPWLFRRIDFSVRHWKSSGILDFRARCRLSGRWKDEFTGEKRK